MHIDPYTVSRKRPDRLLRRYDRAGGGALMMPMLILLFGV
jgi:hypothetical protein